MSFPKALSNDVFFQELKTFISENNVVGTCAGVIIALSTKDLISSIVSDIIIPTLIFLFSKLNIKMLNDILPSGKSSFELTDFIKKLITWFITLIVTFIFIKITFQILMGVNLKKKEDEEDKKETFYTR